MNYSKGYIYKIICKVDDTICYIGSTFNTLRNRWQEHKKDYKKRNGVFSIHKYFDKYKIENFKIILIKEYLVCRDGQRDTKHLYAYETLWINKTKSCINKHLPFQPLKKEYQRHYKEQHREKNREEINKKQKEYYEKNKAEINKKNKEYYEKNKEKMKEYKKEYNKKYKIKCELCDKEMRKDTLNRHKKNIHNLI